MEEERELQWKSFWISVIIYLWYGSWLDATLWVSIVSSLGFTWCHSQGPYRNSPWIWQSTWCHSQGSYCNLPRIWQSTRCHTRVLIMIYHRSGSLLGATVWVFVVICLTTCSKFFMTLIQVFVVSFLLTCRNYVLVFKVLLLVVAPFLCSFQRHR